jgi:hypothetical protein
VDQIVEEALAFPHQQSVEAFQAQVDVCLTHDTVDRLSQITAPTLVLAGELDVILPPRFGRFVADAIPNAAFDVLPGESHQPFQEVPDAFNARVDAFWRELGARTQRHRCQRASSSPARMEHRQHSERQRLGIAFPEHPTVALPGGRSVWASGG